MKLTDAQTTLLHMAALNYRGAVTPDGVQRAWELLVQAVEQMTDAPKELVDAYAEAIDQIEDWAGYAAPYFRDKHDLDITLTQHRARLERWTKS